MSSSSSSPVKVRVTVSGSSCTCSGFKEVDQIPSRPYFCCTDEVLRLQDDLHEAETARGLPLTVSAYADALKTLVREKTATICGGTLPPVPVYRIPVDREHAPTFTFLWERSAKEMTWSSHYGLDPETVWEYIAALFFLHRACGNMVVRPDVSAKDVAAAYKRLGELHEVLKDTLLTTVCAEN